MSMPDFFSFWMTDAMLQSASNDANLKISRFKQVLVPHIIVTCIIFDKMNDDLMTATVLFEQEGFMTQ